MQVSEQATLLLFFITAIPKIYSDPIDIVLKQRQLYYDFKLPSIHPDCKVNFLVWCNVLQHLIRSCCCPCPRGARLNAAKYDKSTARAAKAQGWRRSYPPAT